VSAARGLEGCVALALALAFSAASAQADEPPAWRWELGAGADHLSGAAPGWRQVDLQAAVRLAPRQVIEGGLRRTSRGGGDDTEWSLGASTPLDAQWTLAAAATASPTHRVLPRTGLRVEAMRALAQGWVVSGQGAWRDYAGAASSQQFGLGVERYVGAWRWSGALGRTRLAGAGNTSAWRAQLDRYFAEERGRIGLLLAQGRELEGVAGDVLDQRVSTVALLLTQPLAPGWALVGELQAVRNADGRLQQAGSPVASSRRQGLRLALRHGF
jgi:YaiO family outer membrane protein